LTYQNSRIIYLSDIDRLHYYPSLLLQEIDSALSLGHEVKLNYLLLGHTHFLYFPNSNSGCVLAEGLMTQLHWYYDISGISDLQMKWNEIDDSLF
jgi:hypothetical protein